VRIVRACFWKKVIVKFSRKEDPDGGPHGRRANRCKIGILVTSGTTGWTRLYAEEAGRGGGKRVQKKKKKSEDGADKKLDKHLRGTYFAVLDCVRGRTLDYFLTEGKKKAGKREEGDRDPSKFSRGRQLDVLVRRGVSIATLLSYLQCKGSIHPYH